MNTLDVIFIIVLVILILGLIGGAIWYFGFYRRKKNPPPLDNGSSGSSGSSGASGATGFGIVSPNNFILQPSTTTNSQGTLLTSALSTSGTGCSQYSFIGGQEGPLIWQGDGISVINFQPPSPGASLYLVNPTGVTGNGFYYDNISLFWRSNVYANLAIGQDQTTGEVTMDDPTNSLLNFKWNIPILPTSNIPCVANM